MTATNLYQALRNVTRQANRSRASFLTIAFGTVAMILATGFVDWIIQFGQDHMIQSEFGHVQVSRSGFREFGRADPHAYLLPKRDASFDAAIEDLRGLEVVAPRLLLSGMASSGDTTLSFIGEGVDAAVEAHLSKALRFPHGRDLIPDDVASAILGRGLAANLGIQVGESVVLLANTHEGGFNAVEATVVGVFESITKAYDDIALRLPIQLARELRRSEGEHLRLILLHDAGQTDQAIRHLRNALPAEDYEVTPWFELADYYNKTAALFKRQVGVIHTIIAVIIVLAISNTMTMIVMERLGEIGTMMALGTRRIGILSLFVIEGSIIGLLGVAGGLVLGIGLALLISAIGIPMPPGPGMSWGFEAEIMLTTSGITTAAAIAFGTTLLASLYPAWKASRLEIVDALRTRQ